MVDRPGAAFGRLLQHYRIAAGMTQQELAERSSMSVRGISDLERGLKARPRLVSVRLLADALGLPAADRAALIAAAHSGDAAPGLASIPDPETPPVRVRSRVPSPTDPLVGRTPEIVRITALLTDPAVRLVTLRGTGGIGKTRLALEIANRLAPAFPDGVAFVPLAAVRDPARVPHQIAAAHGIRDLDDDPVIALADTLAGRRSLLVLDNMEQVAAAGPDLARLLALAPDLTALVTSRTLLRVAGERDVPLPPLSVPGPEAAGNPEAALRTDAVRLFLDRADAVAPGQPWGSETVEAVAEICRRLDGLPLAIELAAARANALSPREMLAWLDQRLSLLGGSRADLPERQRTLRNAIAWSHDLLTPEERACFRRLAVFRDGFSLGAAHAVAAEPDADPSLTLDLVSGLIDKSLLLRTPAIDGGSRFRMLETIAEFAGEALEESGEAGATRARHLAWAVATAERLHRRILFPTSLDDLAPEVLDAEFGNMVAALEQAAAAGRDDDAGARLLGALWFHWATRGLTRLGIDWLCRLVPLPLDPARGHPTAALLGGAWLSCLGGHGPEGEAYAREALARTRASEDPAERDVAPLAATLLSLSFSAQGRDAEAIAAAERAASLAAGSRWEPWALNRLGVARSNADDYAGAVAPYDRALELWRGQSFSWGFGSVLSNLGWTLQHLGEWSRAADLYREQIAIEGHPNDIWGMLNSMLGLARIAIGTGEHRSAGLLLGAIDRHRQAHGIVIPADDRANRAETEAALRIAAGDAAVDAWLAEGRALGLAEAAALANTIGLVRRTPPPDGGTEMQLAD